MLKKMAIKMNESIDKTQAFRNRMLIRTLVLWTFAVLAYFASGDGEMTGSLYAIQIISILASLVTTAISLVIIYVEFFVMSKIGLVTGNGLAGIVIDQARDIAIDKIRNINEGDDIDLSAQALKDKGTEALNGMDANKLKDVGIDKLKNVDAKKLNGIKNIGLEQAKSIDANKIKEVGVEKLKKVDISSLKLSAMKKFKKA